MRAIGRRARSQDAVARNGTAGTARASARRQAARRTDCRCDRKPGACRPATRTTAGTGIDPCPHQLLNRRGTSAELKAPLQGRARSEREPARRRAGTPAGELRDRLDASGRPSRDRANRDWPGKEDPFRPGPEAQRSLAGRSSPPVACHRWTMRDPSSPAAPAPAAAVRCHGCGRHARE